MEHNTYTEIENDIISKSFFKHFTKYANQHTYFKFIGITEIELWYLFSRSFSKDNARTFSIDEWRKFFSECGVSIREELLCKLSKNDFYDNNVKVLMLEQIVNMAKKGDTEAIDFLNLLKY